MPSLLFPIETSDREIIYKLIIAISLTNKFNDCFIGSKNNIYEFFKFKKKFIYIDKGYHQGVSENIYNLIKKSEGIIVNIDEEGGVDFIDNPTLKKRYANIALQNFTKIFLWGSAQKMLLDSKFQNKINVTGSPRFDLLKKEYKYLFKDQISTIKNIGEFILVCTNMSFGNNIKGDDFIYKNYINRFKNIRDLIVYDKLKLRNFIELINQILESTDKKIVLRVHPEEDQNNYISKLINSERLFVTNNFSIHPWLHCCDLMIHHDCTTGVESRMSGTPTIAYLKDHKRDLTTYSPIELSHKIYEKNKMIKLIKEGNFHKINYTNDSILENYFSFSLSSLKLIISEIKKIIENDNKNNISLSYLNMFYLSFKFNFNQFLQKLKLKKSNKLQKQKLKSLNSQYIKKLFDLIVKENNIRNVKIIKINSHLYWLKHE